MGTVMMMELGIATGIGLGMALAGILVWRAMVRDGMVQGDDIRTENREKIIRMLADGTLTIHRTSMARPARRRRTWRR